MSSRTAGLLRGILAAAACLVAIAAQSAQAAAPDNLTVTGTRAASVMVDLSRTSTLRLSDLKINTRGTYAGFALQDRTGQVVALSVNVRRWIASRPSVAKFPITNDSQPVTLRPGRYRLLLLTDGPSTVTVPATGSLARTVWPTTRYDDDVRINDITTALPLASSFAKQRVTVRKGGTVLVALHSETYLNQLQYAAVCLAQPGSVACNPAADLGGNNLRQTVGGDVQDDWTSLRFGASVPAGGVFDARIEDATADIGTRRDGLVIVI